MLSEGGEGGWGIFISLLTTQGSSLQQPPCRPGTTSDTTSAPLPSSKGKSFQCFSSSTLRCPHVRFHHTLSLLLHPESSDSHKRFYSQHKAQMFQHQQVGFHLETVLLESSEVALLRLGSLGSEAASTGPGAPPPRANLSSVSVCLHLLTWSMKASQVEACRNTHSETNHLRRRENKNVFVGGSRLCESSSVWSI